MSDKQTIKQLWKGLRKWIRMAIGFYAIWVVTTNVLWLANGPIPTERGADLCLYVFLQIIAMPFAAAIAHDLYKYE